MKELPDKMFFRPDEAAKIFGVSRKTIYRWVESGTLKTYKPSKRTILIPRESMIKSREEEEI